jgi:hypothetical protein
MQWFEGSWRMYLKTLHRLVRSLMRLLRRLSIFLKTRILCCDGAQYPDYM